jgi:hypothetical protein
VADDIDTARKIVAHGAPSLEPKLKSMAHIISATAADKGGIG